MRVRRKFGHESLPGSNCGGQRAWPGGSNTTSPVVAAMASKPMPIESESHGVVGVPMAE